MLSKEDIEARFPALLAGSRPAWEYVLASSDEFSSPSSEQSIHFFRARKDAVRDAAHFYVRCVEATWDFETGTPDHHWSASDAMLEGALAIRRDATHGTFKAIDGGRVLATIKEYCGSLLRPLPACPEPLHGTLVRSEWNDVVLVAATEDSYVAFFWSTSA